MSALAAAEAYRRWAPTYDQENAVTALDCELVATLSQSPCGTRLLDVGCGTGRRVVGTGALRAVGVEPCAEMLASGRRAHAFGPEVRLVRGDARDLPLPDKSFDLVWCRLMIGHLPDCRAVYSELGRVTVAGGQVVVTDFHPEAHAAGFRRTFRDGDELLEVEHYPHSLDEHRKAGAAAGLRLAAWADGTIGSSVKCHFKRAGKLARYAEHRGRPVVLGMAFVRDG